MVILEVSTDKKKEKRTKNKERKKEQTILIHSHMEEF
jgi:hypothetical protein